VAECSIRRDSPSQGLLRNPALDQDLPVLEEESAIYTHFPTFAEVADHIPMDGGLVLAP